MMVQLHEERGNRRIRYPQRLISIEWGVRHVVQHPSSGFYNGGGLLFLRIILV